MAIGTTPLFSKISGSAGPVDYRTRRNGKIEIGKKRIPANPQSTRQLEVRAGYGRLHELWQNASYIDKAQYERLGKLYNISAWNAFLLRHQSAMSAAPAVSLGMVESSGNTLHDLTQNENHCTLYGPTWCTTGPANLSAVKSDEIDDYAKILHNSSLNFSSEMTLIHWHKPTTTTKTFCYSMTKNLEYMYRTKTDNSYTYAFYPYIGASWTPRVFYGYGVDGLDKYHHVAVTYDENGGANNLRMSINGILKHTTSRIGPLPTSANDLCFGSSTHPLNGLTPELNLYPSTLSQEQILNHYNTTKHLYGVYP